MNTYVHIYAFRGTASTVEVYMCGRTVVCMKESMQTISRMVRARKYLLMGRHDCIYVHVYVCMYVAEYAAWSGQESIC